MDNSFFRTMSFSDGCSRFFSHPWSVFRRKRLTLDDMGPNKQYGTTIWAKNGWETARNKDLYGLDDCLWAWWTHPQTLEPSSSPYRSLVRAVSQPFLSQHLRYIVPTSKYLFKRTVLNLVHRVQWCVHACRGVYTHAVAWYCIFGYGKINAWCARCARVGFRKFP